MAKVADSSRQKVAGKKTEDIEPKPVIAAEKTPEEILKERKHEAKAQAGTPEAGEPAKENKGPKSKTKPAAKEPPVQKRRSRLERRGKHYQEVHKLLELGKGYGLDEAVNLLPKLSYAKFDASVEIHVNLNVDPRQADQLVRGTVTLPHGSGKTQKVAVYTTDVTQQAAAKAAGADLVADKALAGDIANGKLDFDVLVATPDMMAALGKLAKILGPKGLMPNPKSGTVTTDLAKTVTALKAGRLEFRVDSGGIVHSVVGKVSYKPVQLIENVRTFMSAIEQAKPASVKVDYIKRVWLTVTMGPSLRLNLAGLSKT